MGLLGKLKEAIDPRGPLGEVLSPSEVFKTRLGLPVTSPHQEHVRLPAPPHLEGALAPARFIAITDAVDVPSSRVRQVSAFVEEHFAPVYQRTDSTDLVEILRASQNQIGWSVTQRRAASSRVRHHSPGEFQEVLATAQIQATDDFYNQYYETIPGNDPVILDGEILKGEAVKDADGRIIHDGTVRGGTLISHGRREYREKTAGMLHWDVGVVKARAAAQAEMESRPARNVRANLERVAGEVLPMRRLLANPRYDRSSGC
jgi:hypothetical protein